MDELVRLQIEREQEFENMARDTARQRLVHLHSVGNGDRSPVVVKEIQDMVETMLPVVEAYQAERRAKYLRSVSKGERLSGTEAQIWAIAPDRLTYVLIKAAYCQAENAHPVLQSTARLVGKSVNLQYRWDLLEAAEKRRVKEEIDTFNRVNALKKTVKEMNPKRVALWLSRLDAIHENVWPRAIQVRVGIELLTLLSENTTGVFEIRDFRNTVTGSTVYRFKFTDDYVSSVFEKERIHTAGVSMHVPLIAPPIDWRWDDALSSYVGGYYTTLGADDLVVNTERGEHGEFGKVRGSVPHRVLEVVNRLQKVQWCVNERVYAVMCEAYENNSPLLPIEHAKEMPEFLSGDVWNAMDMNAKREVYKERRLIHDFNNKTMAKRYSLARKMRILDRSVGHVLYFVHSLDFRGRLYTAAGDLHPQSDDYSRGALMFANGVPLGEDGLEWLAYAFANAAGNDKLSRTEQLQWVNEQIENGNLEALATDPLGPIQEWWSQFRDESPWQMLAIAQDMYEALQLDDPREYVSHIPCPVDGSCNGLQHLSAMGLDEVGGRAVNLMNGPRSDIYQIVANEVNKLLEPGSQWEGRVTRKVVKRAVMTTPYGVTKVGIKDQLLSDGMVEWADPSERNDLAWELTRNIVSAVGNVLVAGTRIMEWFKACVDASNQQDTGIYWHTPMGTKVTQEYHMPNMKVINTVLGNGKRRQTRVAEPSNDVNKRRQRNGISPNIIHSFDAAHCQMTVLEASKLGINSFACIHDSFGTHAGNLTPLGAVIREAFVSIYSQDWLSKLYDDFKDQGLQVLPPESMIERGNLDIKSVLNSEYFFS